MSAVTVAQPELYCIVPRELADGLVASLQEHLGEHGIKVIRERRTPDAPVSYEIRRQRALHLPRSLPPFPPELAHFDGAFQLVQRMPSPGLTFADDTLEQVLGAVRGGDAIAASELVWRMHARVATRLARRLGQALANARSDEAMGRMLDRLPEFTGSGEAEFHAWLDHVVDGL